MAIKGKKKKSGGRAKAAAPKRPLVAPKTRLLARKGIQIGAAASVALMVGLLFGWAFWHGSASETTLTSEERATVADAQKAVEGALAPVGRPVPPANFIAFPDMTSSMNAFANGALSAKELAKRARQATANAQTASTQIGGLDMASITAGLPAQTADQLRGAQEDLKQGLLLFETTCQVLIDAAAASGKEQSSLLSDAAALHSRADELISSGYRFYLLAMRSAGLPVASPSPGIPQDPTGIPPELLPGLTGSPAGAPSP